MRSLRVDIRDADPAYVAMKLGGTDIAWALYAHLRSVPAIAEFRRDAIRRAAALYHDRAASDALEAELSGLGLLVLQRSMFAVEDLGGLLNGIPDRPSWSGLVSYNLDALTDTFKALFAGGEASIARAFLLPSHATIRAEPGLSVEVRNALCDLRDEALTQVCRRLERVAEFWTLHHRQAKKIAHGLGFIAGSTFFEPPGPGRVADVVGVPPRRPFVISLETTVDDDERHVNTELSTIALDRDSLSKIVSAGESACESSEFFAAGWLHGLQTNHAYALPLNVVDDLPIETSAVLRKAFSGN